MISAGLSYMENFLELDREMKRINIMNGTKKTVAIKKEKKTAMKKKNQQERRWILIQGRNFKWTCWKTF